MYSDPAQLESRVRNDLTAVMSNRFVSQLVVSQEAGKADETLDALLPERAHRFRRRAVEDALVHKVATIGRAAVTAPLGGGKTILTAQVAVREGWIFVESRGLNRLGVMARVANALRQRVGQPPVMLTSEDDAIREALERWEDVPDVTVVVDEAGNPRGLWEIIPQKRRLVITSRGVGGIPSAMRLQVPRLTREELTSWVAALKGRRPDPGDIVQLETASAGNPLYLRLFALGAETSADLTLRQLELRAVQELPAEAREIVSYLALSPRQLRLADLQSLLGAGGERPQTVARQLAAANGILEQRRGAVGLVHEHLRETVVDELHVDSIRLSFFASRLGRFFEKCRDPLAAFHVYFEADEQRHSDRVLDPAAHQAVVMGGGAPAIPVLRRQAKLAEERGDGEEQLRATLLLAGALRQTGAAGEARGALDEARIIVNSVATPTESLWIPEVEAALHLDDRTRSERIAQLEGLQRKCVERGDRFGSARMGTVLAVEYISGGDYRCAEGVARGAVKLFEELGDEYGTRIARLNLASALSGIEGREGEAARVVQELDREVNPERYPRERALLCNYLARRYRGAGDLDEAARFALEAIQIGKQLKDEHVIALNRITLGNVKRDGGELQEALVEYHAADRASVKGRLQDSEAAANELIASVHNQLGEYDVALHHAHHAAAVARMADEQILIARAEEERALALQGKREIDEAIEAYRNGIMAIGARRPGGSFFVSLTTDALQLCTASRRVDLKIDLLSSVFLGVEDAATRETSDHFGVLYRVLPAMADRVNRVDHVLTIAALAMADVLADSPAVVQRRIVLQATKALVSAEDSLRGKGRLAAVAAILMTQTSPLITLGDIADLAERLVASPSRLYFKPLSDGAGHWTVLLDVADGIVLSLVQLDDDPRTGILAMVLALLLASLDDVIASRLLDVEHLPRQEGIINVASRTEVEVQLGPALGDLGDMPSGFSVSESTDIVRSDQPPMLVVRAEESPKAWRPSEEGLSDVHMLLGEVLRALVPHLLARAVEPEVLFPKIGATIREMGGRGAAVYSDAEELA